MHQDVFVCCNTRQVAFVHWLIKAHLVKPIGCAPVEHPLTGKIEMLVQKYETMYIIHILSQIIFRQLLGADGRQRIDRLERCGVLKHVNNDDKCLDTSNKIVFRY